MLSKCSHQDLVSAVYDGAADPAGWIRALQLIQRTLDLGNIVIASRDIPRHHISLLYSAGFDRSALDAYESVWGTKDPSARCLVRLPIGKAAATNFHYSDQAWSRIEYVREFSIPHGTFHQMGVGLHRNTSHFQCFGCARAGSSGPYSIAQARALELLAPHIQRALLLRQKLACLDEESTLMARVLDRIRAGIVMLDQDARIVFANKTAETLLSEGNAIGSSGGKILLKHLYGGSQLHRLIHETIETGTGNGNSAGGSTVLLDHMSGERILAEVIPFSSYRKTLDFTSSQVCSLVFLRRVADPAGPSSDQLRIQYGLTPAEARLAHALVDGHRPLEFAKTHGISKHTVRTQLRSVLAKTDTHRQVELVRLLTAAPVISLRQSQSAGRKPAPFPILRSLRHTDPGLYSRFNR
jgi:DNA-binding CsgD family transcriptional regulator